MTETSRTYGGALYELARDEGVSEDILRQLHMCVGLFKENPELARLLSLPSVPKAERCGVVDTCFKGQVHAYLLSFMKILVENGTIRELPGCEEAYRLRYNEDNGILAVSAVSAAPLTEALTEKLRAKLAATFGKTIELSVTVDPQVLGGMRLELAGKRYDGTVRTRLDEIERRLRDTVL